MQHSAANLAHFVAEGLLVEGHLDAEEGESAGFAGFVHFEFEGRFAVAVVAAVATSVSVAVSSIGVLAVEAAPGARLVAMWH